LADRHHSRPAGFGIAEQRPGEVGELIGFAVTARHQVDQHVVGQSFDRQLSGIFRDHIGQAGIAHQRMAAQRDAAGRRDQPAANIAEGVAIIVDGDIGIGDDGLGADDIAAARGMDRQHDHHRRRLRRGVGDLETDLDFHAHASTACSTETTRMLTSMPMKASAGPT
jgi:hypothetical protein